MALFIFGLIFVLIALVVAPLVAVGLKRADGGSLAKDYPTATKAWPGLIGTAFGIGGVLMLLFSMVVQVNAKDVGVVTSFGRVTGVDLPAGLHWKAPWEDVNILDAATQVDDFTDNGTYQAGSPNGNGISVRIGDGSTAVADLTIRWHIADDQADTLYATYRSNDVTDKIRQALVLTELPSVANTELGTFQPLANVDTTTNAAVAGDVPDQNVGVPDLTAYSTKITDNLNERLAALNAGKPQIIVESVTMTMLELAPTTQDKINAFQQQVGQTRVAQESIKTAQASASANEALSASVNNNPYVLVAQCLSDVASGKILPPVGWSCWPGGSNTGVLVNGVAPAQ